MTVEAPQVAASKPAMTPLWVISLFLSLTEVITGIAVMNAQGSVQTALTTFAIAFPSVVAVAFFAVLWFRPYVLYPPTEFGPSTDVTKYVDAMRRVQSNELQIQAVVQEAIKTTLEAPEVLRRLSSVNRHGADPKKEMHDIGDELARRALSIASGAFVTVETHELTGQESPSIFPYDASLTVNHFLDQVYFALQPHVPPYRYGDYWLLRDAASGKAFTDIGTQWARKNGRRSDTRTLAEVGIVGGMRLEAESRRHAV